MTSLAGRRILVTRASGQASTLALALEREGADTIKIPTIELAPPASYCGLDAALTTLLAYDWLLFTSANAVEAFASRAQVLRLSPQARRVAVIGPATANAVLAAGVASEVTLQPETYVAESLVDALRPYARDSSMLLVRAAEARDVLVEGLTEAGATVTVATAYRNVVPPESAEKIRSLFRRSPKPFDVATFTSASSVGNLQRLLRAAAVAMPPDVVLASIGPVTSQALLDAGWTVSAEAAEATISGLVSALITFAAL